MLDRLEQWVWEPSGRGPNSTPTALSGRRERSAER